MSSYQKEQIETLSLIRRYLAECSPQQKERFKSEISDYLLFRRDVDAFLNKYFGSVCTQRCYQQKLSACCSREGIITFFGDVFINTLVSEDHDIDALLALLQKPNNGYKCIYLGNQGCLWRVKPIVCEMFLCNQAKKEVFEQKPWAGEAWKELKKREKCYTWPDRPVLFDALERYFIEAGYSSPLMYLHNSPGLLRIKEMAKKDKPGKIKK